MNNEIWLLVLSQMTCFSKNSYAVHQLAEMCFNRNKRGFEEPALPPPPKSKQLKYEIKRLNHTRLYKTV